MVVDIVDVLLAVEIVSIAVVLEMKGLFQRQ